MPHDFLTALGPGVRAIEMPAAFDAHQYSLNEGTVTVGDEPLTVRADSDPWWYMVSFPARENAFVLSSGEQPFGWLTRFDGELLSGCATLAYITKEVSELHGEAAMRGSEPIAVVLDGSEQPTRLIVRRGALAGSTSVRVSGFRSYYLIDQEPSGLRPPEAGSSVSLNWSRFYGTPSGDLVERLRYLRFCRLDRPRFMPWLDGLDVLIVPGQQISQAVYVSGVYEPSTTAVLRRLLGEGDTFVDVGANVGLFSMIGSRSVGRTGCVVAFEPSRREFARLREHIDHNRLLNVEAFQVGVGNTEGSAILHVADSVHAGLNTMAPQFMYPDVAEAYRETVPVVRLDDFLPRHSIDSVQAIKIDVEGGEADVIAGAERTIARDRPAVLLEIGTAAQAPADPGRTRIEAFLQSVGYEFVAIDAASGSLRRANDLTVPSENFLAARPAVVAGLGI